MFVDGRAAGLDRQDNKQQCQTLCFSCLVSQAVAAANGVNAMPTYRIFRKGEALLSLLSRALQVTNPMMMPDQARRWMNWSGHLQKSSR